MKKVLLCAFIAVVVFSAGLSARGWPDARGNRADMLADAEKISISGNLAFFNNRIALSATGKTYYLAGIQELIGFVPGLNEGATVKIDGVIVPERERKRTTTTTDTTVGAPVAQTILVSKVNFNGKDYSTERTPR